ncbi:hypothetical protein ACJMK2_012054 [Sinanodonta woodiana]|uniref:Uncharacterized protein n=1 Tax=Sinanodonta woodiana TaxID=1069815 RepID=A0ABD3V6Z3_SINWO
MALVTSGDKSVVLKSAVPEVNKKPVVKVLDEETYTEEIEQIIEADFFPDLPKLKAQAEYFEALEKNDLVKLREIQIKYSRDRPDTGISIRATPATFETPDHHGSPTHPAEIETRKTEVKESDKTNRVVHLDKFLMKNTSEDNASFAEILEETQKKHCEKHAWLFENEKNRTEEENQRLALPGIEEQAALENGPAGVDTWKYTTRNAVMYVPDGVDFSSKELMEMSKKKPREIIHENTRFKGRPWNERQSKTLLKQAASEKAHVNQGRIGHDGKEVILQQSPMVNGYGFVATPSPAPGVEESPLMTWGEIEGTPLRLDGNDMPIATTPGPAFRIPDVPQRDKIAFELAEKASKAHRDKKEKALKIASRLASPLPKFGLSTTERISSMSPAAQKLVNSSRLGIRTQTDKALRASYSPSPGRTPGDKTPSVLTPSYTPKSSVKTPSLRTPENKRAGETTPSLTDDLLQIPKSKRPKASDFF